MENRTVLIVDDEKDIIHSINRIIRREPYRQLYASDGREAQKIIKKNPVHLIITDLSMPEMSGFELLKWVKKNKPEIVRMVMSVSSDSDTILEAINKGNIYRYIPKPWDNSELKMAINQGIGWFNLQEEKRNLVKKLENYNRMLEQRVKERTDQLLAIQSEAEIGKHTSQIVHNLNNSLNNVLGSLNILDLTVAGDNPDFDRIHEFSKYAIDSAHYMSKIVSEILVRAKSKENLQNENIDINQLIEKVLLFWEINPIYKYHIEKAITLEEKLPFILGNPVQIKQILDNVIKNSIDAMEHSEEKILSIGTKINNGMITIKISDTGEGIAKEDIPKVFLPDFSTKPIGKGTGLGLASVKTMVEAYSGTIDIKSKEGAGTTVAIGFPYNDET